MKAKSIILIIFTLLLGCKKDSSNIVLSTTLTDCPTNYNCTYNYFDQTDLDNSRQLVRGGYRVFLYNSIHTNVCGPHQQFYVKTALNASEFLITSKQIASGQIIAYDIKCPCCATAFLSQPISGEIKGKKTDATHWLINATIIFDAPADTLKVNQYFSLAKLP
ncbi:MAG: hypothetical protein M3N14_05975 [Bacteroidota bacterium]|nr:hypothetical protein [Bacteroidota bacterium]